MRGIFVFGSNLGGRHGAGSAAEAVEKHGAVYGQGRGLQGESYAIPTLDENFQKLGLEDIDLYVKAFIQFAETHPDWEFTVVKIGCGLAGFREAEIRPMFRHAPRNCILPKGWR